MAGQADQPLESGSTPTPETKERAGKKWLEEHGGLILLIIVLSVISFVILYESCMY